MKKKIWILFVFLVACRSTRVFAANTYWVSKSANSTTCVANDRNSPVGPYLSRGVACLSGGDTLYIRAATYDASGTLDIIVNPPAGLGPTQHTIIAGDPMDLTDANNPDANTAWIKPNMDPYPANVTGLYINQSNIQYVTFRNLKLDGNKQGITKDTAWKGVSFSCSGCQHIVLENSEILNWWRIGVESEAETDIILRNNHIHHTGSSGEMPLPAEPLGRYGIYGNSNSTGLLTVENNEIDHNDCYGLHAYKLDGLAGRYIIRGNKFHDNSIGPNGMGYSSGNCPDIIVYGSTGTNEIYNNLFYNSFGGSISAVYTTQILNNTFWNSGNSNNGSGGCNNLNICVFEMRANGSAARNNLIIASATIQQYYSASITYSKNICPAISTYCEFSSNESTEFVSTNSASSDFLKLKTGALARDKGANLTTSPPPCPLCTDKAGVARPPSANWDIGAYQFSGTAPVDLAPVENFVYTSSADLAAQNCTNGTINCDNWIGPWVANGGTITVDAAPSGSFSGGNAAHATGTIASNYYDRAIASFTTGSIIGQMRKSVQSGVSSFGLTDSSGLTLVVVELNADGHIRGCGSSASPTDLGTWSVDQFYYIEMQLDAAGHPNQVRARFSTLGNSGTFSSWFSYCQTAGVGAKTFIYDATGVTHDFWVDSIGAKATTLAFTTQPSATVTTDVAFSANVSVTYSNGSTPVPGRTDSIILTVCPSSPTASLSAVSGTTKAAVNGTASWSDLVLSQPAGAVGVTLCANSGTLTQGVSTAITINGATLTEAATPARIQARIR